MIAERSASKSNVFDPDAPILTKATSMLIEKERESTEKLKKKDSKIFDPDAPIVSKSKYVFDEDAP